MVKVKVKGIQFQQQSYVISTHLVSPFPALRPSPVQCISWLEIKVQGNVRHGHPTDVSVHPVWLLQLQYSKYSMDNLFFCLVSEVGATGDWFQECKTVWGTI